MKKAIKKKLILEKKQLLVTGGGLFNIFKFNITGLVPAGSDLLNDLPDIETN